VYKLDTTKIQGLADKTIYIFANAEIHNIIIISVSQKPRKNQTYCWLHNVKCNKIGPIYRGKVSIERAQEI
jgi:hypothetical protein